MEEMGHLWVQNQHALASLWICSLDFSEVITDAGIKELLKVADLNF